MVRATLQTMEKFTPHGFRVSLFLISAPSDHQAESKRSVERMILFDRGKITEVEPVHVVANASSERKELSVSIVRIFVEITEAQRDQPRATIPVLEPGRNVH